MKSSNPNVELSVNALAVPKEEITEDKEVEATGKTFDVKYNCSKLKESGKWWDDVIFEINKQGDEEALTI